MRKTKTVMQGGKKSRRSIRIPAGAATAALLLLTGCVVGPKYHVPSAPVATAPTYKESPANFGDTSEWHTAQPQDALMRGKWWEIFNDPELNALEEQLNINNQNIAQYFQNYMEARALVREARSQFYPTLGTSPSWNRLRSSGNLRNASQSAGTATGVVTNTGSESTLWTLPLSASWEPDLWGKIRNTVRQAQYSAQLSAADLENERLSEQASLAEYFFELRGQDALQEILNNTVTADQQALDLTTTLYQTGVDDRISVVEAQNTLQATQAAATNLRIARAQYEHAIAMLVGKPATDFSIPVRPVLTAPPPIPVGLPSQLLERRPDIAAAERNMAAANAEIGIATAAFYPTLTLSAQGGYESSLFKHIFDWPSRFWSIGPTASETIFDAGLRRATVQQYVATYNGDVATYRQTVITAFQQVEDALAAVRILSQQIQQEQQAVGSAQEYLRLQTDRYKTGVDPYALVVTAQTTLLSDQQTLASLQIQQMTAAVQLIEALGGGWDRTQLPSPSQVSQNPSSAQTAIVR